MSLEEIDNKIESSHIYQFFVEHKKIINIIQGFIVIGLLIGINMYVIQDYAIKKQIAENCGYTTSKYKCICEKNYADNWEEFQKGNFSINLSGETNVGT